MKLKFVAALAALASSTAVLAGNPGSVNVDLVLETSADVPDYAFALLDTRKVDPTKSFNDYYNFHLDGVSDVTFSAISDPLYNAAGNVLLKVVVFDSIKLSGPNDFLGTGTISPTPIRASFGFKNLAAGDYTITLLGHAEGKAGGSYYGDLGVTGAVPEPESMALALAGLGVIGMLARRRKGN
ncbi:MAG TPA: FxDxF family PEP-CTERM protein [Aquabacterium sp.]|uniref:FxDxF family PEP-CTERM protein n=1 Tax=Aquabacterium sp. TaxID=1872578 RepID=UPI002E37F652|nr:FxDxF family PEP-CTERM protein [Aquabacterium sp.]HEX5357774.1 FxDxF family PEP-CTERM protein [Aquabacterium sp.]